MNGNEMPRILMVDDNPEIREVEKDSGTKPSKN